MLWPQPVPSSTVFSRVSDNQSVKLSSIPVVAGEVYGPDQAHELGLAVLERHGRRTRASDLAFGWPGIESNEVRHDAADEALESLLADFPSQSRK